MPTQNEARDLWCPFARPDSEIPVRNGPGLGIPDRSGDALRGANCVASCCMAWRWRYPDEQPTPRRIEPAKTGLGSHEISMQEPLPVPRGIPGSWRWFPGVDWGAAPNVTLRVEPHWQEPPEETEERFRRERVGYCGLAGKPT